MLQMQTRCFPGTPESADTHRPDQGGSGDYSPVEALQQALPNRRTAFDRTGSDSAITGWRSHKYSCVVFVEALGQHPVDLG
jgi:hypothetical protein